jgi:hypothetical protein
MWKRQMDTSASTPEVQYTRLVTVGMTVDQVIEHLEKQFHGTELELE